MMNHTMNVMICDQQFGYMLGKSTTLHHVCFENADGKVLRESEKAALCLCESRESLSGVPEKYVRLVQD